MVNPGLTDARGAKSARPSGADGRRRLTALATFAAAEADGVVLAADAAGPGLGHALLLLRIPITAGAIADDDVARCLAAGAQAVVLSGVRTGMDLGHLGALLAVAEARAGRADGATRIVAEIATAEGLLDLRSLVGATPRLAGLGWDADALRADLGAATLTADDGRLIPPLGQARSLVLAAAAAAGVTAIDSASTARDTDFRQECVDALRDGFAAKLATTPAQLRILRATAL